MNCPQCNEHVSSEDRFCGYCGSDLSSVASRVTTAPASKKIKIIFWFMVKSLIFTLIGLVVLKFFLLLLPGRLIDQPTNMPFGKKTQPVVKPNQAFPPEISQKTQRKLLIKNTKPMKRKAHLTVRSNPQGARIRILNIAPKYRDGIELNPGSYHIEVTLDGYQRYLKWIKLADKDVVHSVALDKKKEVVAVTPTVVLDKKIEVVNVTPKKLSQFYSIQRDRQRRQAALLFVDMTCSLTSRALGTDSIMRIYSKHGFRLENSALKALDRWWGDKNFITTVRNVIYGTECESFMPSAFVGFDWDKLLMQPSVPLKFLLLDE